MPKYTFTFKKNDVFLEYITTDKESMERQFQIWVTCASVWAYNQDKIEKGLMSKPLPKVEVQKETLHEIQQPVKEIEKEEKPEVVVKDTIQSEIDRESQRIIEEYKAEMEAEARKKEADAKKEKFKTNVEEVVAKEEEVKEELSELYTKPATINELQLNKEKEKQLDENDFDSLLQKSMASPTTNVKEKQDDRFLKVIKVKNVKEKLDFLIVTAYYLSEFERLDRFTLKLVNAKLMENMHEVVDNTVLQDAISKGLVECLPNYTNIPSAMEYRLTEAGETAFLNGRS